MSLEAFCVCVLFAAKENKEKRVNKKDLCTCGHWAMTVPVSCFNAELLLCYKNEQLITHKKGRKKNV